jgi:hypothetical protein
MPQSIKTIAIPAFRNGTQRYQLARLLPADMTREFISRTKYKIVDDPNMADAVLQGTLVNFVAIQTLVDPTTSRATSVQVIVNVDVMLTERATGKVLVALRGLDFRERYQVSINPQAYFDESATAIERVSKDVAQSVVTSILENF